MMDGVLFQLFKNDLDRLVQLRVFSFPNRFGIELNFNVRCYSPILHFLFTGREPDSPARRGDATAVDERRVAIDANEPAPSPLANE